MEKKNAFRVILLSILVSYMVCEAKEPDHLLAVSSTEVRGFKNFSPKHADAPLRSRQQNFPVQISTITDSFPSDVVRIGSLDGRVLPASTNVQKSTKWTTDDKILNVSTMRKLKFALRRFARRQNVFKSSHGTGKPSFAPILKGRKDKEAFLFQKTPSSSITGLPYQTKIKAPFKLTTLPTEERVIPSVDTTDAKLDWLSKEDNKTEQDDRKSSHSNDKGDNSLPHGERKVSGHDHGSTQHSGTSTMPQHKMAVYLGVKASSALRWKAAYDHVRLDDNKKGKHFKYKKKKSQSEDEEPEDSSSPAAILAGILAGILMFLFIVTGVPRLWRIFNKCWQRRTYHRLESNFPSTGYCSEELSEEEIIFDRSVMERNKVSSSKEASPRKTPEVSSGRSQSAPSSHECPGHPTQEPKIWTLTNTPRSAPLMAVPTCGLTDNTVLSPPPLTTEARPGPSTLSEETTSESSVSQNPSKPSVSLLSTASDESLESDSASSSTVSCKTPVAARNEVVIIMDHNDRKIIHPADKSEREVLNVAKDTRKGSSKEEAVITRSLVDEEESSVKSESESSTEEVISKNQEAEMKDTKKGDAIIDIVGSDNNNEETSTINEKSNDGHTHPRDAVTPRTKREVRWKDKSTNPLDTGASTSSTAKIRVMNHKDYKTWKELQKDIKAKKAQGTKPHDVLPGLQVIRDIYNMPRIPVDSEGGCLCYYCEKHLKRARREKLYKIPSKLFSFKWRSAANEAPPGSEISSTSSAAKIRVMNHKDYKTWKALQKDIKMKKAQGIKSRDVLPGLQVIRDIYNMPRIPVESEGGCLCYYCEKHIKRTQREKLFKLPRFGR